MSKNSRAKRKTWADVKAKRHSNTGSANTPVAETAFAEAGDVIDITTDYVGRHRAPENPCAPFTSDSGSTYTASSDSGSTYSSGSDSGSTSSPDTGSSCGE
jgi:hypothetical protein